MSAYDVAITTVVTILNSVMEFYMTNTLCFYSAWVGDAVKCPSMIKNIEVNQTCVDWMTVRSLTRENPAPIAALNPAVPKDIREHSLPLSSSTQDSWTKCLICACVAAF